MAALDEFVSSFSQHGGPALLNRFEVVINAPEALSRAGGKFSGSRADKHISFRVENVTMPGRNIRTVTNENIYGPTHEMAQGLTYAEDVSMTFLLSAEHFERNYFMLWMDYIYKPNTFDLEYYTSYIKPITIWQLNKNKPEINQVPAGTTQRSKANWGEQREEGTPLSPGNNYIKRSGDYPQDVRVAGVRLNQAFPKTLGPIEYSMGSSDIARQEVSFAFKDITFLDSKGNVLSNPDPAAKTYDRNGDYPVTETPQLDFSESLGVTQKAREEIARQQLDNVIL